MMTIVEIALFPLGFILGVWYTAMLILPLFYGLPKAIAAAWRREIRYKAVFAWLIAPFTWTVVFMVLFGLLAFIWPRGFDHLRESASFNFGHQLGALVLILNAIFSKKSHADMRSEFDTFTAPFRIREKVEHPAEPKEKLKRWGWGSYVVAGIIWAFAQGKGFNGLVVLIIAIAGGLALYPSGRRLGFIKNRTGKNVLAGVVIVLVAAFVIGFLSPIADGLLNLWLQ